MGWYAYYRTQELGWIVRRTSSEISQTRWQSLLWRRMEVCGVRGVAIAKWLLYWETRVPWQIRLIGVHRRGRGRIHLVSDSLRRNPLLDTERAEVIERVLVHPILPSWRECRAQARD